MYLPRRVGALDTPEFIATQFTGDSRNASVLRGLNSNFNYGSVIQIPAEWVRRHAPNTIGSFDVSQFPPDVQTKIQTELAGLDKRKIQAASAVVDFVQNGRVTKEQAISVVSTVIGAVNPAAGAVAYMALTGLVKITEAFLAAAEQLGWTAKGSIADPNHCYDPYCDGRRRQYDISQQSPGGCCRWCGLVELNTEAIAIDKFHWSVDVPAGTARGSICTSAVDAKASFETLDAHARYLPSLDWITYEIERENLKPSNFRLFYYTILRLMWEQRANCLIPKVDSRLVLFNCLALWNAMHEEKDQNDRWGELLTSSFIPTSIRRAATGGWSTGSLNWMADPFVSYTAWVLHDEYDQNQGPCASSINMPGTSPVGSTIVAPSQVQGQRIGIHIGPVRKTKAQLLNEKSTEAILRDIESEQASLNKPNQGDSKFPWGWALLATGVAGAAGVYLYSRSKGQTVGRTIGQIKGVFRENPVANQAANRGRTIAYRVRLDSKHEVVHIQRDGMAVLTRFGSVVSRFRPLTHQLTKIRSGEGVITVFRDQLV